MIEINDLQRQHFIPIFERQKSLPAMNGEDIQTAGVQRAFELMCKKRLPPHDKWYTDSIYPSTQMRTILNSAGKAIAFARQRREKSARDMMERISYFDGEIPGMPQALGAIRFDISKERSFIGVVHTIIIDGSQKIRDIVATLRDNGIDGSDDRFDLIASGITEGSQVRIVGITFFAVPRSDRKYSVTSASTSQGKVRATSPRLDNADRGDISSL